MTWLLALLLACSKDADGDGAPAGTDCADDDPARHAGASEACDGVDSDCDGLADDADPDAPRTTFYADLDGDGYGRAAGDRLACEIPADYVTNADDCDDARDEAYPGATELCDGIDTDCDGLGDDGDPDLATPTWYYDDDGDGYGDPAVPTDACEAPPGYVADATDCDDGDIDVSPGAEDACDGVDTDCDGYDDACERDGELLLSEADAWILGEAEYDAAGSALALADVDGDGVADLATAGTGAGDSVGAAWLTLGPFEGTSTLSDATLRIAGTDSRWPIDGVALGDLDGDSVGDLVVATPNQGAVAIVSGTRTGSLGLADADATLADTDTISRAGAALAIGDLDGDGANDLVVGAPYADTDLDDAGVVSIVTGPTTGGSLADATARLLGESLDASAGASVAVGDLDGDGALDLVVGSPGESTAGADAGVAYVRFGPIEGEVHLADADARLAGEEGDSAGTVVAVVGDVDGDGATDLMVGGPRDDDGGTDAGAAWLVLGPPAGSGSLAEAHARRLGPAEDDRAGSALAAAGDLDGDGDADVLVGGDEADQAWLLLAPFAGTFTLAYAEVVLVGAESDAPGTALAGGLDADGDGAPDALVGSPGADEGGDGSGTITLVRGWEP